MARKCDPSTLNRIKQVSTGLVLTCLSSQLFAAGFQIQEQNVTNLGLAYSGTAALAEDASTGFYNSAGLTRIEDNQVVVSVVGLHGEFDFTASSSNVSLLPNTPVPGEQKDDAGATVAIPGLHVAARISDTWMFGFNVTTPFGLKTEYDETGIARYLATNSKLETFNFAPSVAYQWLPCFSVGLGIDAMYAKARLEARVGQGNSAIDGFQKNHGDGWGIGFHGGLLWEPFEGTRLGLNYRSKVNMHVEGDSEQLSPLALGYVYTIRDVRTQVTLPETATFSFYHAFDHAWAMVADVAWTNWSRLRYLQLRFDPGSPAGIDTDTDLNFKDTFRYALGVIYNYTNRWVFRFGLAYDETPVRDDYRTARIPDEDRIWVAIGGAYNWSSHCRIDFGYSHLFFKDASILDTGPHRALTETPATLAALSGTYDSHADLLGIQIRYDFA